jgi:hypothetical protein
VIARRERLIRDGVVLALALAVVVASVVLTPGQDGVRLFGVEIPSTCLFRTLTGHNCLGCGLTRSFVYMGHLQARQALSMHLLGPFLYLGVAAQVPWRVWSLARLWWHPDAAPSPRS